MLETLIHLGDISSTHCYRIGPYIIFIQENEYGSGFKYLPRIDSTYIEYLPLMRKICSKYPNEDTIAEYIEELTFSNLMRILKNQIRNELLNYRNIVSNIDELTELLFWEIIGLSRLAPFLQDDNLEEIFIDGLSRPIYVNHRIFGKCDSDILLTKQEIDALMIHVELHKGTSIKLDKGNLETEIAAENLHVRINIDLEPLATGGPYVTIRNLRKNPFILPTLIKVGTLSLEAAKFLLLAAWSRLNITIAGEVDTGKTTLLNAIDLSLPPHMRKIYIEDALESIDLRVRGRYQAFYRAEAYSEELSRRRQVTFSLHRTPDYLILGEILTDEDVETFFYSLSCGLKGLQTIHARSIDSLIRRWIIHHRIPIDAIKDLDVIVFMRKNYLYQRRVEGIYELEVESSDIKVKPVFERVNGELRQLRDIRNTNVYKKAVKYFEDREIVDELLKMFEELLKIDNFDLFERELYKIERVIFQVKNKAILND